MDYEHRPRILLQNTLKHVPDSMCRYLDCIIHPHHCQHLNPLNAELNPICHLLALLGPHHIPHVSRIRVNSCTKKYSEPLNCGWTLSRWENQITGRAAFQSTEYHILFPQVVYLLFYILPRQKKSEIHT